MLMRVSEILPRFYKRLQEIEDAQKIGKLLLEVDAESYPDSNGRVRRASADGHNRDRRRGTPIISKGVSGTAPGTDPVAELLRKEARRELTAHVPAQRGLP